jgi:hypothetical protein
MFWLAAALALAAPSRANELDVGPDVTFSGATAMFSTTFDHGRLGAMLWDSGPSDPASQDFRSILFQARASGVEVAFEAAIQDPQGRWSRWVPAELNVFPGGRLWGRFKLPGRKGSVLRFRATEKNRSSAGSVVELYSLELAGEADDAPPSTEGPEPAPPVTPPGPPFLQRSDWGAEAPKKPFEPMVPVRISVHHTEGMMAMTKDEAIAEMKAIQSFHKRGRGWNDIAYHFIIDGAGRIWRGRPETAVGSHVSARNEGNVGISLMGNFQSPKGQRPTAAQLDSLTKLAIWLTKTYVIPSTNILGHRDQGNTDCPGDRLYAKLPDLRKAVDAALAVASPVVPAPPPALFGPMSGPILQPDGVFR